MTRSFAQAVALVAAALRAEDSPLVVQPSGYETADGRAWVVVALYPEVPLPPGVLMLPGARFLVVDRASGRVVDEVPPLEAATGRLDGLRRVGEGAATT